MLVWLLVPLLVGVVVVLGGLARAAVPGLAGLWLAGGRGAAVLGRWWR